MKKSYFKSQWGLILCSAVNFILAIYLADKMSGDPATLEALTETTSYSIGALFMLFKGFVWLIISLVQYNKECIEELEDKLKKLEDMKAD